MDLGVRVLNSRDHGYVVGVKHQMATEWTASRLPDLTGKVAIVTGANSGIGFETALALAQKHAHVVLACRNEAKAVKAVSQIQQAIEHGKGSVEFMRLNLSSLASVEAFVKGFAAKHNALHLLINNAGIIGCPFTRTVDGYELQFATNHLGHFALTCRLFDLLKHSAPARIVNVSSCAHRTARMHHHHGEIDDRLFQDEAQYHPWATYANTKLCNILFTKELQRRLEAAQIDGVQVLACHPGAAATNILQRPTTSNTWLWKWVFRLIDFLLIYQSAAMGALPTLYAATSSNVHGGEFIGPNGFCAMWGYPTIEDTGNDSHDLALAAALWTYSERCAKLRFIIESSNRRG